MSINLSKNQIYIAILVLEQSIESQSGHVLTTNFTLDITELHLSSVRTTKGKKNKWTWKKMLERAYHLGSYILHVIDLADALKQ